MIADVVCVSTSKGSWLRRSIDRGLRGVCLALDSHAIRPSKLGPKVGLWQQRSNARAAARLIDEDAAEK